MTEEFNKWWDENLLTEANPYVDGTPAYWAWEGWQAALSAPVQDIDWKDMYEKQKRRSEMWVAKYEKDIGPLEYAAPLAAPVQEPVAVVKVLPLGDGHKPMHWADWTDANNPPSEGTLLHTAAQRQWVGLTDEEVGDLSDFAYANDEEFVRNVEAKLKEKNA